MHSRGRSINLAPASLYQINVERLFARKDWWLAPLISNQELSSTVCLILRSSHLPLWPFTKEHTVAFFQLMPGVAMGPWWGMGLWSKKVNISKKFLEKQLIIKGWAGTIQSIQTTCCHGTLSVALEGEENKSF